MRKLIKWTFFSSVALVGAGFFFLDDPCSYFTTAINDVRTSVRGKVPLEFELKRARNLIRQIDPQVRESRRDVARSEVAMEHLKAEIQGLQSAVAHGEIKVRKLRAAISGGQFTPASYRSEFAEVKMRQNLIRSFDLLKSQTRLLEGKESLYKRQTQVMGAAREKLLAIRAEKQNLEDLVTTLDAQKRSNDAMAAAARNFTWDTSPLGKARKLLDSIETRLRVQQKLIQEDLYHVAGIPEAAAESQRDILKEVDKFIDASASDLQDASNGKVSTHLRSVKVIR
jgi:chromosome segregation ATPase